MPQYEFKCPKCAELTTRIQRYKEKPDPCKCGEELEWERDRQLSRTSAPIFKGTGWYVNDYGGKKPK